MIYFEIAPIYFHHIFLSLSDRYKLSYSVIFCDIHFLPERKYVLDRVHPSGDIKLFHSSRNKINKFHKNFQFQYIFSSLHKLLQIFCVLVHPKEVPKFLPLRYFQ